MNLEKLRLRGDRVLVEMLAPEVSSIIAMPETMPSSTFKILALGSKCTDLFWVGDTVFVDYRSGVYLDGNKEQAGMRIIVREADLIGAVADLSDGTFEIGPAPSFITGDLVRDMQGTLVVRESGVVTPERIYDVVKMCVQYDGDDGARGCYKPGSFVWVRRGAAWDIKYRGVTTHIVPKEAIILEEVDDD